MHGQRRHVLRIVRTQQRRSVATATARQPQPDDETRVPAARNWALPPPAAAPPPTASRPPPTQAASAPSKKNWTLPLPGQTRPSDAALQKWALPSSSGFVRAAGNSNASSSKSPLVTNNSVFPTINHAQTRTSQLSRGPQRSVGPLNSRLDRDLAPHQRSKLDRDLAPHQDPRPRVNESTVRRQRPPRPGTNEVRGPNRANRNEAFSLDGRGRGPPAVEPPTAEVKLLEDLAPQILEEEDYGDPLQDSRSKPKSSLKVRKTRGSLVERFGNEDVALPNNPRGAAKTKPDLTKVKKHKPQFNKKIVVDVYIPSVVSVGTLARLLNVRMERLQRKMVQAGMGEEASYDHVLTSDYAVLLAEEFGRNPIVNDEAAFDIYPSPPHSDLASLPLRPPIVTIMGHVDHGKTTLLDTLRSASVAKGEAGGITQHIGAFSVAVAPDSNDSKAKKKTITFLDTPGHAAFSAMRARGAGVTDIVVLVVAADDGVMPQTKEVIELVKRDEGKVGVVVAINKVDKPGVDVDFVQKALLAEGIQLETFGGDVPAVQVSGLTGFGLGELTETLSTMAEIQDLRAENSGPVHGFVIESKVLKGLGPVATVLITRGCLSPGAHILAGQSMAKVRLMSDSTGATVKAAYPGMAITVSGWKSLPGAGEEVLQGSTEAEVKKAVTNRMRKAETEALMVDVEAINASRKAEREKRDEEDEETDTAKAVIKESGPKELRLVIKGDVSGSVEAVVGALQGIGNKEAVVKIVSSGVGDVSESDVMMAKATEGMIVAFSVNTPRSIEILANQNGISMYSSTIIYRLMDEIKTRVIALLPKTLERKVTGEATVLQLFDIHLKQKMIKKVAGCRVTNGLVEKGKSARVIRDGETVFTGSFDTLRHLKKDITEAKKGSECGLSFEGFGDLREGDLVQVFTEIEKLGVL